MRRLVISIDFDQTIVSDVYPKVGRLMYGAKETIQHWHQKGHEIVINTCREGEHLRDVIDFLRENDIPYDAVNRNAQSRLLKYGIDSRKVSCDVQLDDKNLGGFLGWKKAADIVSEMENRKPIVICIVGESGTGKTTLADWIERAFGVPMILSYTDRPARSADEDGHTFISPQEMDAFRIEDMIAYTEFGGYRYCCLREDVRIENTYVIDEDGYLLLLKKHRKDFEIYSIRLRCPEYLMKMRGIDPERRARDRGKFTLPNSFYNFVHDQLTIVCFHLICTIPTIRFG
jgi:guanylate kinase